MYAKRLTASFQSSATSKEMGKTGLTLIAGAGCCAPSPSGQRQADRGGEATFGGTGEMDGAGVEGHHFEGDGEGVDGTFVFGVNEDKIKPSDTIISNASCTTNCLAPLAKVLHEKIGIVHGLMTTIHAYTNDQVLTDVFHKDLRRARSATHSQIPTKTGAAVAVGLVLPELNGRLDGFSMRIPTINVSCVDLTFVAKRATSKDEIDAVINEAANGKLKGVMAVNTKPLVSIDFNHNPASCTYDATQTRVMEGTFVKVLGWYDNEWGFSNRMLDMTEAFANAR